MPHGMNVFECVFPSDAFPWGSPSLGLFSSSQRQKVSHPKNGAVHLPAPAHRHVDTVFGSVPCCIGPPIESIQLNSTAVTAFDCLKNTLPTTHCGVLKVITMMIYCHRVSPGNRVFLPSTEVECVSGVCGHREAPFFNMPSNDGA